MAKTPELMRRRLAAGWESYGLSAVSKLDGEAFVAAPVLVVTNANVGAVPDAVIANNSFTATGFSFDITAGENLLNAGHFTTTASDTTGYGHGASFTGTDDSIIDFDAALEEPPDAPVAVNVTPAVLELIAPAITISRGVTPDPAVLQLVAPTPTITIGNSISPATLELVAPAIAVSLSVDTTKFLHASRVEENATCVGNSDPYSLSGAISANHQSFAVGIGLFVETEYYAVDPASGSWEHGYGVPIDARLIRQGAVIESSTGSRIAWTGNEALRVRCVRGPSWLEPTLLLTDSTTAYTMTFRDSVIVWNPGDEACALTLLAARWGKPCWIMLDPAFSGSGTIAIAGVAGGTITLTAAGDFVELRSDRTRWLAFARQVT